MSYRAGTIFSQLARTLCIKLNIFIFQNHAGINNYFYFNINISTCFEYMCFLYLSYFGHLFTCYSASKNTTDIIKKKKTSYTIIIRILMYYFYVKHTEVTRIANYKFYWEIHNICSKDIFTLQYHRYPVCR